jgi:predicted Zn-dependent peptidase
MSSRLFQEIREKRGLAYTVYSYISSHVDIGKLGFYLAVRPDMVVPALEVLFNELELVRSGRLEQAELDAAREYLKGSVLLTSESSDSRMMRLARNEIAFERLIPFEELLEKVNAVTVDEVIELARTRLDPASLSIVSYGPYEKDLDLFS